jgi:hypothetical protein
VLVGELFKKFGLFLNAGVFQSGNWVEGGIHIDTLTYVINDKTVLLVTLQFLIIPYYPNSEPWIS